MIRPVIWSDEAIYEFRHAQRGYVFAVALTNAVRDMQRNIAEAPESFPRIHEHYRYAILPRFFFKMIFQSEGFGNEITILAFAHPRRAPLYWKK